MYMADEISVLLEEIDKINAQIHYVYRTVQNSVGPGSHSLFQELENLYVKKREMENKLTEVSCKTGNNS